VSLEPWGDIMGTSMNNETTQEDGAPNPSLFKSKMGGRVTIIMAVIALIICPLLGLYTWALWSKCQVSAQQVAQAIEQNQELTSEIETQKTKTSEVQAQLTTAKSEIVETKASLDFFRSKVEKLAEKRENIEEELKDYKRLTDQFRNMIDTGKLKVNLREGRMILQLQESVLFPSGSAELSDDGHKAIKEVARILRKFSRRRFIVAGHTDNVPIGNSPYESNWELSTTRALVVTKKLIASRIEAKRLAAAGFASTEPIASNNTKKGRQKNRRIEIIVEPKIRKLPKIKNKKQDKGKVPAKKKYKHKE
jgi:chemotaxis protein MotB